MLRRAIEALFRDPSIARNVSYYARGSNMPRTIRAIVDQADAIIEAEGGLIWAETTTIEVRVADVPDLRPGDRFVIDGAEWVVHGEPVRDADRLVWKAALRPSS